MKFFLLIFVLLISFNTILGCRYIGYPEPPLSYIVSKTKTIYVGKVIAKSVSFEKNSEGVKYRVERIKLKVEKASKDVDNEIQEITIAERVGEKDSCYDEPPKLKVGEKWIISKDFIDNFEPRDTLRVLFIRNYLKFSPKYHIEYLKDVENIIRNPVTAIYGQVQTDPAFTQIKDIEVFIEGNGVNRTTKPGKNGEYSFEDIPAGAYKIQIRFLSKTKDIFNNRETIFNEKTKTFNLEYETTLKTGDSDYYYVTTNGIN